MAPTRQAPTPCGYLQTIPPIAAICLVALCRHDGLQEVTARHNCETHLHCNGSQAMGWAG
jgi:hypothetical protein